MWQWRSDTVYYVFFLDPNRDPNTEKSRRIQADTMDAPPSPKYANAPESVVLQRFPALIVSSRAGGHWFESSSLHQKVPDFVKIRNFFRLCSRKIVACWDDHRLTQTVTQKPRGQESTGEGRMASSVPLRLFCGLHGLADDAADGLQALLMGVPEGIRVEHGAGLGRYE